MNTQDAPLQSPALIWDANGQPKSAQFDDFYFNTDSGLDESRYVFLEKNNLQSRWQALASKQQDAKEHSTFTIAETGFGTGLNFLAAWHLWCQCAPNHATLHFVSVEKYPLSRTQIAKALALWPELQEQATALLAQYPLYINSESKSVHRLNFSHGSITIKLTLIFDDAISGFKQLLPSSGATPCVALQQAHYSIKKQTINAWFLDGFSPSKNPDMWQPALYELIAKLSQQNTTLSTFTAIKSLREGLSQVGFSIKKATGFGKKREMVTATFNQEVALVTAADAAQKINPNERLTQPKASRQRAQSAAIPSANWHLQPTSNNAKAPERIAIVGAGLAGCHSANALAKQGVMVTIFDEGDIASGASGNPQGVVYTRFSHQQDTLAEFNSCALPFADSFYVNNNYYNTLGARTGVLHLATNPKDQVLQKNIVQHYTTNSDGFNTANQSLDNTSSSHLNNQDPILRWCEPKQAETLAGIELNAGLGGLFTPYGGWLQPAKLCQQLLDHPNINVLTQTRVTSLECAVKQDQPVWGVHTKDLNNKNTVVRNFDAVVLATAHNAKKFTQANHLGLKPIRGQITQAIVPPNNALKIKTCICGKGHIAPLLEQNNELSIIFGATFAPKDLSPEVTAHDNNLNIDMLANLVTLPPEKSLLNNLKGRTGFRCTTRDYLPFVGPVANGPLMLEAFARYRKNKYAIIDSPGQYHHNLYINVGHGSRGLAYTPLCAEILTSVILGSPLPVTQELYKQLHPSRFLIRDLAKNKI